MNGNRIIKTFILPLLVIAGLLALHYLPEIEIFEGKTLRQVDILADIKADSTEMMADSIFLAEQERERKALLVNDSIFPGVVPIEDLSPLDSGVRMMDNFYSKLDTIRKLKRPLRIAYYGDSFVGGDIMTSHLREYFQNQYGGNGIGAFDVVAPSSRSTLLQRSEGLDVHLATKKGFMIDKQGITNSYYISDTKAMMRMDGTSANNDHVNFWPKSYLYFRPVNYATIYCRLNGGSPVKVYSGSSKNLQKVSVGGNIHTVEWQMQGKGNYYFFASNEDTLGVVLDNFSLVGSSGTQLSGLSLPLLQEFAAIRDYDMIIFHYGLNTATPDTNGYGGFKRGLDTAIENFRKAWPDAAMMIVSVSDRCKGFDNGKPTTMKGIEKLVTLQHDIAKEHKIAFWNLYAAMKSLGGIAKMQERGEANKDYTHINYKGGKVLAEKFYEAFDNGIFNYRRKYK